MSNLEVLHQAKIEAAVLDETCPVLLRVRAWDEAPRELADELGRLAMVEARLPDEGGKWDWRELHSVALDLIGGDQHLPAVAEHLFNEFGRVWLRDHRRR